MRCPKCSASLEPVVYAGIEIDRCTRCHGLWFDAREIDRLQRARGAEILDSGDPHLGRQWDNLPGDIPCPRCRTRMVRWVDLDRDFLKYERCPTCQGLWLDAGEFRQFQLGGRAGNWLDRLASLLAGRSRSDG